MHVDNKAYFTLGIYWGLAYTLIIYIKGANGREIGLGPNIYSSNVVSSVVKTKKGFEPWNWLEKIGMRFSSVRTLEMGWIRLVCWTMNNSMVNP